MEDSKLKNMVVLKNLPSNLVEEAFIILKSNKNAKKLAKIEKNPKKEGTTKIKKGKDYILKEAEMIISEYLTKIENNKQLKNGIAQKNKYKKLKLYSSFASFIILLETIMLIVK